MVFSRLALALAVLAAGIVPVVAQDADKQPPRPGRGQQVRELDLNAMPAERRPAAIQAALQRRLRPLAGQPNEEPLWSRARSIVDEYLLSVWRRGLLVGAKPEHAYFARCDRTSMTGADIDAGRLICEVGVATLRPAEFATMRVGVVAAPPTLATPPPERRPATSPAAIEERLSAIQAAIEERLRRFSGERNDEALRARMRAEIEQHLDALRRDGILLGRTAAEAYYARCERPTPPPKSRAGDRPVCEFGVALRRPGEFEVRRVAVRP